MPDNNVRRPGDWYSRGGFAPDDQPMPTGGASSGRYYTPGGAGSCGGFAAEYAAKEQKRRRRGKTAAIIICAVLVAIAAGVGIWKLARSTLRVQITTESAQSLPDLWSLPDTSDMQDEDDEDSQTYDDYREYFENYYQTSGDINLPAAETGTGVTLTLHEQTGETLSIQDIYDKVSPAVVGITTYLEDQEYGWGTGVVFTADGYIITNTHVLQSCDKAVVVFSTGEEYEAELVGADEASDIAVLHIDGEDLPYAEFGQSDTLRVGDEAIAIGNPLGQDYAGTMTDGIISAINRNVTYNGHTMTLLQTNAALNEGNSGGPLINSYGQVVGITNMKIMSTYYTSVEGIGFAIPSAVVKEIADQLIENGVVLGEATIGIVAGSVSQEAMELYDLPMGVYISEVNDGSDAKEKGLQVGDVIVKVNGESVSSVAEVNLIKEGYEVGDSLTLTIYRDGETFDVDVVLVDKSVIE